MKITIRGHDTRGKEVIQILESLGGINKLARCGDDCATYYYISDDNIIYKTCSTWPDFKRYTLEEFEEEFPFKIGDDVYIKGCSNIYTITALEYYHDDDKLYYKLSNELHYSPENLKLYKVRQERNVTLTLEKAKEWYNKGGELKEIALQAYSEEELNPLPRSWEEFTTKYARMGYYISADGKALMCAFSGKLSSPHVCPSKESAEAHLAMIQLEQLRDVYRRGWVPIIGKTAYTIKFTNQGLNVYAFCSREFLSFETEEIAKNFLKHFRDLIEKAGDLI